VTFGDQGPSGFTTGSTAIRRRLLGRRGGHGVCASVRARSDVRIATSTSIAANGARVAQLTLGPGLHMITERSFGARDGVDSQRTARIQALRARHRSYPWTSRR
jgi:hypothetical protein